MTIRDAERYVKQNIDNSFIVQNINKSIDSIQIIEDIEELITIYNKDRECRLFYDIYEGAIIFIAIELLDEYSTDYDTDDYNYVHTNLGNALQVFKLQNKKSTRD